MNEKKLYCQIVVCALLLGTAAAGSRIENGVFSRYFAQGHGCGDVSDDYGGCSGGGRLCFHAAFRRACKVVSAVSKANTATKYGEPIDEKSDSNIKQVHAVAGGMIIASGKDKERGLYIEIKHDDAISVYGNLSDISVVESERVQRGEIIGSYDTDSEKDFFYELRENL